MSSLSAAVVPTSAAATVAIAIASAFIYRQFTQQALCMVIFSVSSYMIVEATRRARSSSSELDIESV